MKNQLRNTIIIILVSFFFSNISFSKEFKTRYGFYVDIPKNYLSLSANIEDIIDADKNIYYLNLINQRLNKIREVNDMNANNLEVAISNLKPPIFWKDKQNFILQAKKWSQSKIGLMLKKTYELEKDIKSNSVLEKNILIKKLMIDICVLANF